jgi:hypothetical protein
MAGFWGRLLGKKKRPEPVTPAEQMKYALEELRYGQERRRKKAKAKTRHTDDYRELVIKGDQSKHLPDALASLTAESFVRRSALEEDKERINLRAAKRASDEEVRQEAENASGEMIEELTKLGETPDEHYYSASERLEVGEIDRTYEIEAEQKPDEGERKRR